MTKQNGRGAHALFQSIADDGTTWEFVFDAKGQWVITRNHERIGTGAADRIGISTGVDQFLRLAGLGIRKPEPAATQPLQAQRKGK